MCTEDKAAEEAPELEYLSEELEEALARVHGATENCRLWMNWQQCWRPWPGWRKWAPWCKACAGPVKVREGPGTTQWRILIRRTGGEKRF